MIERGSVRSRRTSRTGWRPPASAPGSVDRPAPTTPRACCRAARRPASPSAGRRRCWSGTPAGQRHRAAQEVADQRRRPTRSRRWRAPRRRARHLERPVGGLEAHADDPAVLDDAAPPPGAPVTRLDAPVEAALEQRRRPWRGRRPRRSSAFARRGPSGSSMPVPPPIGVSISASAGWRRPSGRPTAELGEREEFRIERASAAGFPPGCSGW